MCDEEEKNREVNRGPNLIVTSGRGGVARHQAKSVTKQPINIWQKISFNLFISLQHPLQQLLHLHLGQASCSGSYMRHGCYVDRITPYALVIYMLFVGGWQLIHSHKRYLSTLFLRVISCTDLLSSFNIQTTYCQPPAPFHGLERNYFLNIVRGKKNQRPRQPAPSTLLALISAPGGLIRTHS